MPIQILVGAQWGDEGKGRIVDLLSAQADYIARYNGGDNAGHTVTVGSQIFKLHLTPSGIIHPHTTAVIGNGLAVNPATLFQEFDLLRKAGIEITPQRLKLSHAAHMITPGHRALDKAEEQARGKSSIGTTGRGIGPAYTDKNRRQGIRLEDMLNPAVFGQKLTAHLAQVNQSLRETFNAPELDIPAVMNEYLTYAHNLAPYIDETSLLLHQALQQGKTVLAEGAQGSLLDLDHGTYPYVTSSTTLAPGAFAGLGLGIQPVERVIGVTKVFQTRVGSGPFPSEVSGAAAERLRGHGNKPWDEYGTTTGRPRRVGWLDAVLLRYAARINGLTELALTKLDVLSGLETIRIGTAYQADGQTYHDLPLGPSDLSLFTPLFEELPGWQEDISQVRTWSELPPAAKTYVKKIEQLSGVPVSMISVGPERSQIVFL